MGAEEGEDVKEAAGNEEEFEKETADDGFSGRIKSWFGFGRR